MKVQFKTFTHLIEGVHNGFTFSLLDDNNVTMHTQAQCKDYFQDLWWSENHQKPTEVWGFTWEPGRIKLDASTYRIALKDTSGPLLEYKPRILAFMNAIEKALDYPLSTIEETEDDNVLVLTFPAEWTKSCPMISALTTLIRLGLMYEGGDLMKYIEGLQPIYKNEMASGKRDWLKRSESGLHPAMLADFSRMSRILPRIRALVKGKECTAKWSEFHSGGAAHEGGISGYTKFPEVK